MSGFGYRARATWFALYLVFIAALAAWAVTDSLLTAVIGGVTSFVLIIAWTLWREYKVAKRRRKIIEMIHRENPDCAKCGERMGVVPVTDTVDPDTGEELNGMLCITCTGKVTPGGNPLDR